MAISKIKKLNKSLGTLLGGCSTSEIGTTSKTQITLNESMEHFALLRFNISYYKTGAPDYGGTTISTAWFRNFIYEPLIIQHYNGDYRFSVYWVNATTINVSCVDTVGVSSTHCLSVRGML